MWSAWCRGGGRGGGRGPGLDVLALATLPLLLAVLPAVHAKPALSTESTGSASTESTGFPTMESTGSPSMELTSPAPAPCPALHSTVISRATQLRDGSLRDQDGHVFPRDAYFTTPGAERDELRGCACKAGVCFFKCCPSGKMIRWRDDSKGCVDIQNGTATALNESGSAVGARLVLDIYSFDDLDRAQHYHVPPPKHWIVLDNRPSTGSMYRLNPEYDHLDEFLLMENGSLLLKYPSHRIFQPHEFCMDVFEDTGTVQAMVPFMDPTGALEDVDRDDFMYKLYPIGLMISLPFLVATFAVYALFGELQNLHGKSLMCHVGAMTVAYCILVLVQYKVGLHDGDAICMSLGFVMHFSFLACFFWLNIMCFDIWWTFSGFRAVHSSPSLSDRDRHRFLAYSLYAWGGPLVMVVVMLTIQLGGDSVPSFVIRPDIGITSCYLGKLEARQAYFLGPVGALLFCNLVLFVHTAVRIVQLRRETRALKSTESQRHSDERHRYNVYIKLFLIMGVNWVAEILSGFFPETNAWWAIPDITNSLQGIFIFIIFVGTGRVRRLVMERVLHRRPNAVSSNASTKTSRATANSGAPVKESIGMAPLAAPSRASTASTASTAGLPPQGIAAKPDVVPDDSGWAYLAPVVGAVVLGM